MREKTEENESYGLHWFRRDLRISDNPALAWSLAEHRGRVLGIFCFDPIFLRRTDFGADRFRFFLETLKALRNELRDRGGDLRVVDEGPAIAFEKLIAEIKSAGVARPRTVSFNRDYEPFTVARDQAMIRLFQARLDLGVHHERDHVLIEPDEIIRPEGEKPYQVYSPYRRRWLEKFAEPEFRSRLPRAQKSGAEREGSFRLTWTSLFGAEKTIPDTLQHYLDRATGEIALPPAGAAAGGRALADFARRMQGYEVNRDIPARRGTSQLSIYLKNGSVTIAQAISVLKLEPFKRPKTSADKFLSELIWREFYYYILAKFPRVESEAFQARFAKLKWRDDEKHWEAWRQGRTGYPIVDAGMRQLNQTGWMHNRVRMIVASFLTKDLRIDYRWGERYFMEKLLDGDLAPNNGGWQWAASTGCDAQPYFRIFNPALQSRKFDPEGAYIKRWVPELGNLSAKEIHAPTWDRIRGKYPTPIVDHAEARERALKMFAEAKRS